MSFLPATVARLLEATCRWTTCKAHAFAPSHSSNTRNTPIPCDRMRMSFDELRSTVAPAPTTMGGSMHRSIADRGGSRNALPAPAVSMMLPQRLPVVPDHPQELEVFFSGAGAEQLAAKHRNVGTIDKSSSATVCKGRRDFVRHPACAAVSGGSAAARSQLIPLICTCCRSFLSLLTTSCGRASAS